MQLKLKCRAQIPYIVIPSVDQLEPQSHEEWFCSLCLQENTHGQQHAPTLSPHYLDEWGCSATSPWLFHPTHSTQAETFSSSSFSSRRLLDALSVLASCQKSCLVPVIDPTSVAELQQSLDSKLSCRASSNISGVVPWTFQDRISVLTGLCEVLKSSPGAAEMFLKVNSECQKLWNISSKSSFREADFMKVVKEIAGEEGMTLCRSLLDGIEDDGDNDLQGRVTEGRCTGNCVVRLFFFLSFLYSLVFLLLLTIFVILYFFFFCYFYLF